MDALHALTTRVSVGRLSEPAPSVEQRQQMFRAALRAPDHGGLRPWRFLTVEGEALNALGERMAEAMRADHPEIGADKLEKARSNPLRAPLLVIALARVVEHPKIPEIEQILAVGAAIQNLMLAAHAQGFAAIWRTGELAYSAHFREALGLEPADRIVGFVYLGTPVAEPRPATGLAVEDYVSVWTGN